MKVYLPLSSKKALSNIKHGASPFEFQDFYTAFNSDYPQLVQASRHPVDRFLLPFFSCCALTYFISSLKYSIFLIKIYNL
jgi:hypothetical protein